MAGSASGLPVRTPGLEVEHHQGEPLAAAAYASSVKPVVVEEAEAEGDDQHEGSTMHSHASPGTATGNGGNCSEAGGYCAAGE